MPDFVPTNDDEFRLWLENLSSKLTEYCEQLALPPDKVAELTARSQEFSAALADYRHQKTMLQGALNLKRTMKMDAIEALRPLVRLAVANPNMTPELRGELRLRMPKDGMSRPGVGSETPAIDVEVKPGCVYVHFGTHPQNEQRNGKPAWAKGCNIYRRKAGEPEFQLIAFETRSPYCDKITGPAAEYTYLVVYRGRRASDLGSQSAAVTVAARGAMAA